MQEMTGRKPEGGDERENVQLFHIQGERSQRPLWCFLRTCAPLSAPSPSPPLFETKQGARRGSFQLIPPHSVQGINTPEWLSQLAPTAYTLLSLFHYPWGFVLLFFFSFLLFSGGNLSPSSPSPCSRHQKVSHLLPITFGCSWLAASHLGQCGVSAALSSPPDGTEGGMEGRLRQS